MKCRHVRSENRCHMDSVRGVHVRLLPRCTNCGDLLPLAYTMSGDPVEIRAAAIAVDVMERRPWTMSNSELDGFKDIPSPAADTDGYRAGWLARIIVDHDMLHPCAPAVPTGRCPYHEAADEESISDAIIDRVSP